MSSPSICPNTPELVSSARSHISTRRFLFLVFRFVLFPRLILVVKWELGSRLASRIGVRIQTPLRRPLGRSVRRSASGTASVVALGISVSCGRYPLESCE